MKMSFEQAKSVLEEAGLVTEVMTQRDKNMINYLEEAKSHIDKCMICVAKASGESDGNVKAIRHVYENLRNLGGTIDYFIYQLKGK